LVDGIGVGYTNGTGIAVYFIHADELGTPRVVTDTTNKAVWQWDGDAFGRGLPNQDPLKTGKSFVYHLRYPGQYYDTESGLHYNYFRDYDPETGRYIQSDPIGLAGGFNTYAYVGGNPLNFIDPFGLRPPSNIPPNTDIKENVQQAKNMSYGEWLDAVRNDGKWDYKQQGSQYEEFGNYNYGVTARALGLFGNIPNRGAGWAQQQAGTSAPSWGDWYDWPSETSFGDDPADQYWINEGMTDYENDFTFQCLMP